MYQLKRLRTITNKLKTQFLKLTGWPSRIGAVLIDAYRATFGVILGGQCRFYPSCSDYGYEAVAKYGAIRGSWLALKRVSRCHPLNPGGYDPVP